MIKKSYTLVTGSSGFLGQKILNKLENKNHNILAGYNKKKLKISKKIKVIKINIENFNVKKIKKYRVESLVHLAWPNLENFTDLSHQGKILSCQKNFIEKIIKNGCKNLIIAGTCYEYGLIRGKIKETQKTIPCSPYGTGKDLLRKHIIKLKKKYNFKFTWLRIFYIYGVNTGRDTLTNILISSRKQKKIVVLNNKIERDYVDINYVADVFVKILKNNKNYGVVNLCSGKKISLKGLVKNLKKIYKINPYVQYVDSKQRPYEPEKFYGCNSKLKKILKENFL